MDDYVTVPIEIEHDLWDEIVEHIQSDDEEDVAEFITKMVAEFIENEGEFY